MGICGRIERADKFLFLPEMIHAKILLVDDKEGMVGSNNIDARSFDLNLETGIIFQRSDMIISLKDILKKWRESAVPYGEMPLWRPLVLWNREIFYKTYQSLPLTVPKIVFFENFAYILLTDRSITAVYALRVRVVGCNSRRSDK